MCWTRRSTRAPSILALKCVRLSTQSPAGCSACTARPLGGGGGSEDATAVPDVPGWCPWPHVRARRALYEGLPIRNSGQNHCVPRGRSMGDRSASPRVHPDYDLRILMWQLLPVWELEEVLSPQPERKLVTKMTPSPPRRLPGRRLALPQTQPRLDPGMDTAAPRPHSPCAPERALSALCPRKPHSGAPKEPRHLTRASRRAPPLGHGLPPQPWTVLAHTPRSRPRASGCGFSRPRLPPGPLGPRTLS
ncbi:unnamed protein product [Rangifer tarandus platyrhynchus]|uniref:Uncharacterized protein n=1 Tax=Rangifer tarandus platyrhynchus TaxID=3082113 RepID=A0ABN8Z7L3_RANTA|nr:unnamed protein product [Rangifer tarandus platyrhynchus]